MKPAPKPAPSSGQTRPLRTQAPRSPGTQAARVGAWALLATGIGHSALAAIGAGDPPSVAARGVWDAMADAPVAVGGATRSLQQLFTGFSLTMALMLCAAGAVNLYVLSRAPELFTQHRGLLVLDLVVALVGLVLAVLLLPSPPVLLFAIAAGAFAIALSRSRSRLGAAPGLSAGQNS